MPNNRLAEQQFNCNHAYIITGKLVEPTRTISRQECTKCEASRPIVTITADTPTLKQARAWIAECIWGDIDPDEISSLSDRRIYAGINQHYAGGWAQFISDGE
jgi:hypothetical protein